MRPNHMELITSVKNQYVKDARALNEKKFREQTGQFFAEGSNLLKDLPESAEVISVFSTKERASEAEQLVARTRARVYYISDKVMESLSDTVTPYGLAAVIKKPYLTFALPAKNAILLDGVSDPGNLGAILRTAAAAGFDDVYLLNCADPYSPKTVRASLGAVLRVRVYEISFGEAERLLTATKSIALTMSAKSLLNDTQKQAVTLALGSEAKGISPQVLKACADARSLPMTNGVESLNAAVAASVAMYHYCSL